MERDWNDFKSIYGGNAGAREAFETACETIYRKKHEGNHVGQVAVKQGDGGIDIFIGKLGIEPITVIQCKFFIESFEKSQKDQIRKSFKTAIGSEKYDLKEWILCLPRSIDIDENSWWFKWREGKIQELKKDESFISLVDGNALIDLSKELDLYNHIFKIDDSVRIKEIHDVICKPVKKARGLKIITKPDLILFNNYKERNEPYYIQRNEDNEFVKCLDISNIWVYGKSGVGKTALINRNLINKKVDFCFCDLSPVTITKVDDVLNEILFSIEETFDISRNEGEDNSLKQIDQLLSKIGPKNTIIVIDELSVHNDAILKDIADSFIQLVTYFNNHADDSGLKFVVSTISDPKIVIENKSKAQDHFQYICCDSWHDYNSTLFNILCSSLNIDLNEHKELIIENCRNSPRIMKSIFKKIFISGKLDQSNVEKIVKQMLEEVVE